MHVLLRHLQVDDAGEPEGGRGCVADKNILERAFFTASSNTRVRKNKGVLLPTLQVLVLVNYVQRGAKRTATPH